MLSHSTPALAEPDPVEPGTQADPPQPTPPAAHPPLVTNDDQRRAVRTCSVDAACRPAKELMLEFEREAFPRPGDDPWISGDDVRGHDRARRLPPRTSPDPTVLRPDLKWLAKLDVGDLPVYWDHRVIRYLEFYKNDPRGRRIMHAWLRDMSKYEDLIVARLRKHKLPEDLVYVAMIESSFDEFEYSRVGASGLWQFMPGTGRIYGLEINRWVDERNDPLRATEAAMLMWKDLYQRFGDWHLALAAYNAGYGNVTSAVAKYNTNDFWQLLEYEAGLPWGSQIYVPKAIACAIVGHNRAVFGFDGIDQTPRVEFDTVTVPTSVSFDVIARASGASTREIERLNPHLRRKRTPPGMKSFVVRIPRGRRDLFAERFPQLRGDWDSHDAYVVKHGERFEDIATVHGISRSGLAELNDVTDEGEIHAGTVLVVPRVTEEQKIANKKVADDDLYTAGVPRGEAGDPLVVAVPDKDLRIDGKRQVFYRVVSGDTQSAIADAFGVDRHELARWNGLNPEAFLHPRMVLQVWVEPSFDPKARGIALLDETRIHLVQSGSLEHIELSEGRLGRRRTIYTVKSGGTYADVGKIYGLSQYDLARINQKSPGTRLGPGDTVIVYEVVDPSKSKRAAKQAKKARKKPPKK